MVILKSLLILKNISWNNKSPVKKLTCHNNCFFKLNDLKKSENSESLEKYQT